MSNVNSFLGYQNLPTQVIGVTTDTVLTVPAQGTYGTLPSPLLAAGAAFHLDLGGDILTNATYDGHPFTVRIAGKANVAATACTFTPTLKLGTSLTTGSNTTIGVTGASGSLTAVATNFWLEAEFMWDSISQTLNGVVSGSVGNARIAPTAITAVQVALPSAGVSPTFQFVPSFAFSVANAANSVTVTEFLIDRGA